MNLPVPRWIWSLACAACLAAAAAAILLQPAGRVRVLNYPAELAAPSLAGAGQSRRAAGHGLAAAVERGPETRAEPAGTEAEDGGYDEAQKLHDAVADRPWRVFRTASGEWSQAPFKAYWGAASRKSSEAPATQQRAPAIFQRKAEGRVVAAASPGKTMARAEAKASAPRPPAARALAQTSISQQNALRGRSGLLQRLTSQQGSHKESRASESSKYAHAATQRVSTNRLSSSHAAKLALEKGKTKAAAKALKPPRFKPLLLSAQLGLKAIRPPKDTLKTPDFSRLARTTPKAGPDGKPLQLSPADAAALEAARPPDREITDCRRKGRHWHDGPQALYHERSALLRVENGSGIWLKKAAGNWWAWSDPAQPAWLWHEGRWWWRSDGVWFMLHDGQAWGYRVFSEHQAEGLIHPGTGTQMVYSADGRRAAVITPGDGAWLFDAQTGSVLGRWTEAQMPAKPKPHAPRSLTLPP